MSIVVSPEQVHQIVNNLHHDPFEVLGAHPLEEEGKVNKWVVRAYLPKTTAAWVILPSQRQEYPMTTAYHPHFSSALSISVN